MLLYYTNSTKWTEMVAESMAIANTVELSVHRLLCIKKQTPSIDAYLLKE